MNRSVSQVAKILKTNVEQVKIWVNIFHDCFSRTAAPPKGQERGFTDTDLLALLYIRDCCEARDLEEIRMGLEQREFLDRRFLDDLYLHTPLLQEPPDDLDETWRHGILLNGASINESLELARNYRRSAAVLLDLALKEASPFAWACPVLFTYRHTLELYLKIIGEITVFTHSLKDCVSLVEVRHGKKIGFPVREWILELDKLDPGSTAFRYSNDHIGTFKGAEYWVDFVQFKFAMEKTFDVIDFAILERGARETI